jgi:DtxR family transcriptional regulator, Mn-dependent transcriptional regulator
MLSKTEEDYLKTLFHLVADDDESKAGTNQLATELSVKPASVNSMLKKLKDKQLVEYQKYGRLSLTSQGRAVALRLIRKHRLWETFLYQSLGFSWDEVHEVAEQLEHVQSEKLIERLDQFLNFPETDPHGDPIPNADGIMAAKPITTLAAVPRGCTCRITGVKDDSTLFLQYLNGLGLRLDARITVLDIIPFDQSMRIQTADHEWQVSDKFCRHIFVDIL